jgi:hypothetical protein
MNLEPTLLKLLEAWQDGGLSADEQADLLAQLDSHPELRRDFAEQVAMLGATRAAAEQNPRWLALFDLLNSCEAGSGAKCQSFEAATMERIAPRSAQGWRVFPKWVAMAAAVTLLVTGSFLWKSHLSGDVAKLAGGQGDSASPFVAVVIGASPNAGHAVGTYLKPGMISQSVGWLTVQTLHGVSVTFDAPFQADLLACDRISLNDGRARVRVPEGAEGFRLDSPAFDVVDLGTEFAAMVNDDGTGTCRVFEGEADVSLLDSIGEVKRTQRVTANESVRVTPSRQDMQVIKEVDGDYPEIKQAPRPLLALSPSYPLEVMTMGPLGYWRFEGIRNSEVADEVVGGARLQVAGTAGIARESGGNHSGELTRCESVEFFQIPGRVAPMLQGDFTVGLFAQFEWLQNFALLSAMRYDEGIQGNSFILQSYASFRRSGLNGTGLHAVLRDPPAWDGGTEIYGNTLLRPRHWHHIAATRKGDRLTLYLDGAVVGQELVGSMPLDSQQMFVGRLNGNAAQSRMEARGFVGYLDELAIFPRALSETEILRLAKP